LCFKILKNLRKKTSTFVLPLNAGHLLFYYFFSGLSSLKISRLSQNSFPFQRGDKGNYFFKTSKTFFAFFLKLYF